MTKRPISQDHRDRMRDRRLIRDRLYREAQARPRTPLANLSRHHSDHGLSPAAHAAAKAARLALPKRAKRK